MVVTISFLRTKFDFAGTYKTGGTRMETRQDFLAHGDLLRVSLYGRQGRDNVLGSTVLTGFARLDCVIILLVIRLTSGPWNRGTLEHRRRG